MFCKPIDKHGIYTCFEMITISGMNVHGDNGIFAEFLFRAFTISHNTRNFNPRVIWWYRGNFNNI